MVRWRARSGPSAHQPRSPPSGALTVRARHTYLWNADQRLERCVRARSLSTQRLHPSPGCLPRNHPEATAPTHRVRCHRGDRERRTCCAPRTRPAVVAPARHRCGARSSGNRRIPHHGSSSRRRRRLRGWRRHRAQCAAPAGRSDSRGHRPSRDAARRVRHRAVRPDSVHQPGSHVVRPRRQHRTADGRAGARRCRQARCERALDPIDRRSPARAGASRHPPPSRCPRPAGAWRSGAGFVVREAGRVVPRRPDDRALRASIRAT